MLTSSAKVPRLFSLKGFLRLTRVPNLLVIAFTQYMTAIFLVGDGSWIGYVKDLNLLLIVVSTAMIAAAGYIINDYYDIKVDYVNDPERVVVGRLIKRRVAMITHVVLNFLGIGLGLVVSYKIALVHVFSSFLLWIHSNQLKRLPLLGNLIIGFLTGMSLLIVGIYYKQHVFLVFIYGFFAFGINLIREILKDLEAMRGEKKFGSHTLPITWGIRKTKRLIYGLILFFGVALGIFVKMTGNPIVTTYFALLLPVFAHFTYLLVRADSKRRFAILVNYCNFIMLTGIMSMSFF